MIGDRTFLAGAAVKGASLNLLHLTPEILPQNKVCLTIFMVGTFITNSPVFLIIRCERRLGAMLMATMGGSIEVGMDQARVIMFALPALFTQVTKTVCLGCKNR
jgi:hypothetical protein